MEVSGRAFRMLLETAEAEGIPVARVVEVLPFDAAYLTNPRHRIDWGIFLATNDRVAELLGRDPERLRKLGERMLQMPSFAFMQRAARLLVSPQWLYELGNRWVAPSALPEVNLPPTRLLADGRLVVECELPPHPRSAEWFLHIYIGNLRATPTLLGLPPAMVEAQVGSHRAKATIRLPPSHTLLERARRSLRSLRSSGDLVDVLEAQRRVMQDTFATSLATHRTFRELLDNLPALVQIHRDGRILWVNRALVQKLGWSSADELVGRRGLDLVHPSYRDQVAAAMAAPVANGTAAPPALTTFRMLRRDGGTLTIDVAPAQAVDFDGPARMVVAVDVSERAALEQRLITADRVATIGLLGAGVAHEINNPLAYALAGVQLATRQVEGLAGVPPAVHELLGIATEGLGRVRTIVHDLRMLSRPDDGPPEPTDVQAILESTLTLAANTLSGRARVVREYADVPRAAANGPRLAQVALNLVLNAIEAMPEPGELRVRTLVDDAGRVVFEVQDTGSGIAPDVQPRIFDPFFTTKPIGRGTGLGLAICHQIVAGFRGEITVRSTHGEGSTFRVALPPADPAPSQTQTPGGGSARETPRRRVLIVDDEPQLVRMLEGMLGDHEVDSTLSAADALERLRNGPSFEVVLCDLMMAGMTGMQLYEEVRRVRPEVAARMVFMTGGAFTSEAREFLERVPNRCLEKPFSGDELEAELSRSGVAGAALSHGSMPAPVGG